MNWLPDVHEGVCRRGNVCKRSPKSSKDQSHVHSLTGFLLVYSFPSSSLGTHVFEAPLRELARRHPLNIGKHSFQNAVHDFRNLISLQFRNPLATGRFVKQMP